MSQPANQQKEENIKITCKIPKDLDFAIEGAAQKWAMKKRDVIMVLLADGLKYAIANRSDGIDILCE